MNIKSILKEKKLIIFDIDGTLSEKISWYNITDNLGADIDTHKDIFLNMLKGDISLQEAINNLSLLWKNTNKADKENFISMFSRWKLRKNAKSVISELHKKYQICIITGSNDLYAKIVSEKLGVTHYFSNSKLIFDKEGNFKTFKYTVDQGTKKIQQLNMFLSQNNIKYEDCVAIGDGDNDIEIFKRVDGVYFEDKADVGLKAFSKISISSLEELLIE